ncbi:MAG: gliding motility-associated C-terminal domain-containing protein [Bacteroidales bacterium]|nr:gliding motility-associated C-terminal domain-containing protein [Bacteroidales bacterium]
MRSNVVNRWRALRRLWLWLGLMLATLGTFAHHRDSLTMGELEFIANLGQWDDPCLFKAPMYGGAFFAERDCFTIVVLSPEQLSEFYDAKFDPDAKISGYIDAAAYRVRFRGANTDVQVSGRTKMVGHYNYFIGKDPRFWKSEVPRYHEVIYNNLYDGIDLLLTQSGSQMKYEFTVAPGASPDALKLEYEGVQNLALNKGNLLVSTAVMQVVELRPFAYQIDGQGKREPVECRYTITKRQVGFEVGAYDPARPLVIDPTLIFASLSGSAVDNWGYTATFDADGNLYSGGNAFGVGYPVNTGSFQVNYGGGATDVAISKFDSGGAFLHYTTYLGGNSAEVPHSLFVNENNELYVYGTTSSTNFAVTPGAFDTTFNGGDAYTLTSTVIFENGSDIFISKFNDSGSALLGSTYVGGTRNDGLNTASQLRQNYADEVRGEIILDNQSNVYVATCTQSVNFPVTAGVLDSTYNGTPQDACIVKFSHDLSTLIWSTYLGSTGDDAAYSLVQAGDGSLYICGGTTSTNLPTSPTAVQPAYGGGDKDGFVAHINPNATQILHLTYLGKDNYDQAYQVKLDRFDYPHLYGQTYAAGTGWVHNAQWYVPNGGQFLTKLTPALDSIVWSTAFGTGSIGLDISPNALLVDLCNNIYLSGWGSASTNYGQGGTSGLPVTADALQTTTDNNDYYFLCITDDASALVYATFFGSPNAREHVDGGTSRFDNKGRIYQAVCAACGHTNFPATPGAYATVNGSSNCNIGVIKFDFNLPAVVADFHIPNTVCAPLDLTFQNTSQRISDSTTFHWDFGDGTTSTLENPTHTYTQSGTYTITLVAQDIGSCNFSDSISRQLVVLSNSNTTLADVGFCQGEYVQVGIPPSGNAALTYLWSPADDLSNPHLSNPIASPPATTTYQLFITDGVCIDTITQQVVVEELTVDAGNDQVVCLGEAVTLSPDITGGGVTYEWATDPHFLHLVNGNIYQPNLTIVPTDTTTYYLRVRGNYCEEMDQVTVYTSHFSMPQPAEVVVCYGDSVQLSVSADIPGNYTYTWQPVESIVSGGNSSHPWVQPLENTTYTVTATNEYGCTSTAAVVVHIKQYDALSVVTPASCYGGHDGAVSLVVSGGVEPYFYQWSNGAATASVQHLAAGTYTVTVTDDTGCKGVDSVVVTEPAPLTVSALSVNSVACNDACTGSITVQAGGGTAPYQYQWLHGASGTTATDLCAGVYSLVVIDDHQCQISAIYTVADTGQHHLAYEVRQISCDGDCDGLIALSPDFQGATYQVTWNQSTIPGGDTLADLCPGTYSATVDVGGGCRYELHFQIAVGSALEFLNVYATSPDCYGDHNGALQINVAGGTAPYLYEVNGTPGEAHLSGLAPGTYSITVTDARGCRIDTTVTITEPAPLALSATAVRPPCPEVCAGAIDLTVSGGTYPFRYNWNTAAETQDLTALCAGEYAVTVTDMRNCQATLALTLADSSHFPSPIEAWSDQDTLYAGQQTTFHATDLGAGFSYLWTPGEGIADPTAPNTDAIVSTVSDYVVHVIDDAGCELTDTIHLLLHEVICDEPYVFVPNAFTPNGDGKNDRLFVRSDIVLELQFRVYDRWGEKVFETNSLDEGWDGTFRGQPCEQGVYDYYLKVVCLGQVEFFKKGNVTLIR